MKKLTRLTAATAISILAGRRQPLDVCVDEAGRSVRLDLAHVLVAQPALDLRTI